MSTKLKRELQQELASKGYTGVFLDSWPAKATYYKPDGEAMPNLPADPWSMKKYLQRGFTLIKPELDKTNGESPSAVPEGVKEEALAIEVEAEIPEAIPNECQICGFVAKSSFGLQAHTRKHRNKSMGKE